MTNQKRIYGKLVKKTRKGLGLTQSKLAFLCYISEKTLSNIERGLSSPNETLREAFAEKLSNPHLRYFPQFNDLRQFPEQLQFRFEQGKKAIESLVIDRNKVEKFKNLLALYQGALAEEDPKEMILYDRVLHLNLIKAHPKKSNKECAERHLENYIEFFKNWMPDLNRNIAISQGEVHVNIFKAVIAQDKNKLIKAIEQHSSNSINDVKQIIDSIENDNL